MNRITGDSPNDYLVWRTASGGTIEITDIQIGSERRKGKGRALVRKLFSMLPIDTRVYAITRATNEIAQQFYESMGFHCSILRRFYSHERGVDAVLFVRSAGGVI